MVEIAPLSTLPPTLALVWRRDEQAQESSASLMGTPLATCVSAAHLAVLAADKAAEEGGGGSDAPVGANGTLGSVAHSGGWL
mmetsp:Transcript_13249/g.26633  ORF Transcript_13249/g.26633 Transcript_13249/m.26633 type:complete len:82 (-) Transcript_13249:1182-1427(-)